jgi:hypothetical protein
MATALLVLLWRRTPQGSVLPAATNADSQLSAVTWHIVSELPQSRLAGAGSNLEHSP